MKKKLFLILLMLICPILIYADQSNLQINNPNITSQELKILIIEINPTLKTIDGSPKVSDLFEYDRNISVNEAISDLEYTSHGYIKIKPTYEYLNEFPSYDKPVKTKAGKVLTEEVTYNGYKVYRLKESSFLELAYDSSTKQYTWWKQYENGLFGGDSGINESAYSFSYKYLLDKYNLVQRRNNNEFDQVWLVSIDPSFSFETVMVGKSAYWVNGDPITRNCNNFFISGASFSRRDAQLHANNHGIEGILTDVFGLKYQGYNANSISVKSLSDYNKLNLWEKYNLTKFNSGGDYNGVGNVHFPFNATEDYDYDNTRNIKSNWEDWLNYPYFKNEWKTYNNDAWMNNAINAEIMNSDTAEKSDDRLYNRLWLYLMPHIKGYTSDGYLNNWWKYIYSLDSVKSITVSGSTSVSVNKCSPVPVNYKLTYTSKLTDTLTKIYKGDNVTIANTSIVDFKDGILYGKAAGTSKVTIYHDGKKVEYNVTVKNTSDVCSFEPTFTLSGANVNTSKKIISNVAIGTKASQLYNTTLNHDYLKIYNSSNTEVHSDIFDNPNMKLATGYYVTFLDSSRNTVKYIISIKGDVNGDAKISSLDYVKIKNHIMGTNTISANAYVDAADYNSDNKISSLDYVKVKNYIMGQN